MWKLRGRKISIVAKRSSRFKPYNANISAGRLTDSLRWSHCQRLSIPAKWTGQVNALRCLTDFHSNMNLIRYLHSPFQIQNGRQADSFTNDALWDCLVTYRPMRTLLLNWRLLAGNFAMTSKRLEITGNFSSWHRYKNLITFNISMTLICSLKQETMGNKSLYYLYSVKRVRKIHIILIYYTFFASISFLRLNNKYYIKWHFSECHEIHTSRKIIKMKLYHKNNRWKSKTPNT